MNRIYKLKFDKRRNELVIVSEITAGAGKEKSTGHIADLSALSPFRKLPGTLTPVALLTGLIAGLLPAMVLAADLPAGGQIVGGQGSISTSGNQMTIHQQTQNMATNWHSFDIGKNNTVQFVQPDSSSVALNRVTGASGSQIMGTLKANGQVFILNPNGVLFGKGARVNVGGLVASTKNISTADFMKGQYTLSGSGNPGAQVVNQGSLTTAKGGYIVLAGERVSNSGTVTTPSGKTVLAAGKTVTLQLDNGGLTSVSVNGSVVNALVENRGLISATNGQVYLTAKGQDMLLKTVVNNSGTVEAKGLASRGGEIVLNGGDSGVVSQSGQLLADSQTGQGGKITLEGQNIHLTGGSLTSATGKTGGGEVYVGGGWQGQDSHIKNASKVVMDKAATVDVSATDTGNGGTAVLWSDDYTNFRGRVLAKGGAQSGNGGRVETSSHQNLQASGEVDASARAGHGGEWLLDPTDVTIVGTGADSNIDSTTSAGIFTPTASGAKILNTSIQNQLNAGTNVTVKTSGTDTAGQSGNITLNANITKTAGGDVALTLAADGNITLSGKNITSANGKLDITLLGAGSNTGMVKVENSALNSNGGNITVDQLNHTSAGTDGSTVTNPNAMTIKVSGSTLNATSSDSVVTSGDVVLRSYNPDVNLSQAVYTTTVRNAGAILQIGDTSHLSGRDIIAEGTQDGNNAKSLPVFINGATLTAERDITLRGVASDGATPAQLELRGAGNTLTATQGNITMDNAAGSVIISGTSDSERANITSSAGDIKITGNGGRNVGVAFSYANMSSVNMNITGRTSSGSGSANSPFGGVFFSENVNLHLIGGEGNISAYAYLKEDNVYPAALVFGKYWGRSAINFDGKFHIKGEGGVDKEAKNKISFRDSAVGVWFGGYNTLSFSRDSDLTGSGGSGLSGVFPSGKVMQNINLTSGATLIMQINDGMNFINGDANNGSVGFSFSGDGNVAFNVSEHASFSAFNLNYLDNANLTGSFSVAVDNSGGDAIVIPGYAMVTLKNANITGISRGGGTGVIIQPGAKGNAKNSVVNLNNNIINGTSSTGHGVSVAGNNITLVNGEIKGTVTSGGKGAAVSLTGDNGYTLDRVLVTGTSVDGPGVYVSGKLAVDNGTQVVGEARGKGNGITVSGSLTTNTKGGVALCGTALSGDGIAVAGDTTLTGAVLKGRAVSGNGVNIAGNLTADNTTQIQGHASGLGAGVTLGASLTGGRVSGLSEDGTGLQLVDNAVVTNASLNGSST
ncbi:filamentous hemagglutinin N-terminal domain-containing protein, partial [Salmonella enterica]|nr:filamentous hemagglutinin N-terminal domain-containing protein [Salmonella enterica]